MPSLGTRIKWRRKSLVQTVITDLSVNYALMLLRKIACPLSVISGVYRNKLAYQGSTDVDASFDTNNAMKAIVVATGKSGTYTFFIIESSI